MTKKKRKKGKRPGKFATKGHRKEECERGGTRIFDFLWQEMKGRSSAARQKEGVRKKETPKNKRGKI